MIHNIRDTG